MASWILCCSSVALGKVKVQFWGAMINSCILPETHNQALVTIHLASAVELVNQ